KDVGALAEACRAAGVPLVLAGPQAGGPPPPGVRHIGFVPPDDLPALYGAATVVAYPSRYEGFGLPPVEAMASGAAVLATRVGALPEVAGDAAALVPAGDPGRLLAELRDLLADGDRRRELRKLAVERVRGLSWRATASETLDVYRSLGVEP